ncbi:MAG: flagellar hook-length control protein FliK [Pseudomonadota bacterium]
MPALPTLNLLSLPTDGQAASLPADGGGTDGSAFRSALTRRLSVTDTDGLDGGEPGIVMPLELEIAADGLPAGALLALPVGDPAVAEELLVTPVPAELSDSTILSSALLPVTGEVKAPLEAEIVEASLVQVGIADGETIVPTGAAVLPEVTVSSAVPPSAVPLAAASAPAQQAALPLTSADRTSAGLDRTRAPVAGTTAPLPGALTAPSAGAPVQVNAAPAAQAIPAAAPDSDPILLASGSAADASADSDFLQQLTGLSDTARTIAGSGQASAASNDAISATSAAAWAQAAAPARETASASSFTLSLNRPMGSPEWNQELGERIVWLAENNRQSAELQLNPRELGPMAVRISVADDVARVAFTAQNAVTRDALEAAMPQLRDMLQSQGLSLGEANVSSDNAPAEEQAHAGERGGDGTRSAAQDDAQEAAPAARQVRHDGLFDGYA